MKIIDFERKGNVVRFYLGADDCNDYTGDDWNDRPYEHNAGSVYDEYVKGFMDIAFPFDYYVIEPSMDWSYRGNSPYCKDDFKARRAPCIVVVPDAMMDSYERETMWHKEEYAYWLGADGVIKVYFGDDPTKVGEGSNAGDWMISWRR